MIFGNILKISYYYIKKFVYNKQKNFMKNKFLDYELIFLRFEIKFHLILSKFILIIKII